VQLLDARDPSVDGGEDARARWREYVDAYVTRWPTEWAPAPSARPGKAPPFLRRNRAIGGAESPAVTGGVVGVRVSLGTYRLFFAAGAETGVMRARTPAKADELRKTLAMAQKQREDQGRKWLT
jgi:paired amphipathic helix protein Sin3a